MRRLLVAALLLASLGASACGYQWVRYRDALGDARRVAIRGIGNGTYEPGIDALVSDALVREFRRRGALVLVDDPEVADLVLGGQVRSLATAGRSFSSIEFALEYEVTMILDVEVRRRDGSSLPMDLRALQESELYLASADVEAARKNRQEALRRLASLLAGRVHDALFERALP